MALLARHPGADQWLREQVHAHLAALAAPNALWPLPTQAEFDVLVCAYALILCRRDDREWLLNLLWCRHPSVQCVMDDLAQLAALPMATPSPLLASAFHRVLSLSAPPVLPVARIAEGALVADILCHM
jgi:hypothetical protein